VRRLLKIVDLELAKQAQGIIFDRCTFGEKEYFRFGIGNTGGSTIHHILKSGVIVGSVVTSDIVTAGSVSGDPFDVNTSDCTMIYDRAAEFTSSEARGQR